MRDHLLSQKAAGIEAALQAMRGIRAAKVHIEGDVITAIRVLVVPERDIAETVLDVGGAAAKELGVDVDPSLIEVLRTGANGSEDGTGGERLRRRKLASLVTERTERHFVTRVTLELEGDILAGEHNSPPGKGFEYRSIVHAIVDGLEDVLQFPAELESVEMVQLGLDRLAMVVLRREGDRLAGCAFVRWDEHDAIARATLDALNRLLTHPPLLPSRAS